MYFISLLLVYGIGSGSDDPSSNPYGGYSFSEKLPEWRSKIQERPWLVHIHSTTWLVTQKTIARWMISSHPSIHRSFGVSINVIFGIADDWIGPFPRPESTGVRKTNSLLTFAYTMSITVEIRSPMHWGMFDWWHALHPAMKYSQITFHLTLLRAVRFD